MVMWLQIAFLFRTIAGSTIATLRFGALWKRVTGLGAG